MNKTNEEIKNEVSGENLTHLRRNYLDLKKAKEHHDYVDHMKWEKDKKLSNED